MNPEVVYLQPLQYNASIAAADLELGNTKLVAYTISAHADNDTGRAFPSVKTIAKEACLSNDVVSQHTRRLEEAGYLVKHRRNNNSIVYWLCAPAAKAPPTKPPRKGRPVPGPKPQVPLPAQTPGRAATASRSAPALDLSSMSDEELKAYTLAAPSGSAEYEAAMAEKMRR